MMIIGMIRTVIGAGALFVTSGTSLAAEGRTMTASAAAARPRLSASLLPRPHDSAFAGDDAGLFRTGGGMIELAPFGDGFSLSARDRPDRGGARTGSSLRAGSARGMTWSENRIETPAGRSFVRKLAPALMLGYGQRPARGLGFALEAGLLLRNRILVSPLAGLSRAVIGSGIDRAGGGRGTSLIQARIGYRF